MSTNTQTTETLFERLGGMEAVNAAVDIFYEKVILDERIGHFFTSIDMVTQSGKMKAFMAYAFGAPLKYEGKQMREAHAHMHLTQEHFNAVGEHLHQTLNQLKVSEELIAEAMNIVAGTRDDVLNQ